MSGEFLALEAQREELERQADAVEAITHASKCPSARAPHHVRTGSITWHPDRGVPREVTAERVNASEDLIDRYYDKATMRERMEMRRRPHLEKLKLE